MISLAESKKPYNKRLQATWRLECELGIISDLDCPIDGGWSPWTPWSSCHGACDSVGHRRRLRECDNPSPSKDGMPCGGLNEQIESCYLRNCTIDDYRKLVEGDAIRTHALLQLEAMPTLMERCLQMECPFEAVEAALATENIWQLNSEFLWNALQCVKHDIGCPVTGEWGAWGTWLTCGARCGKGYRWRIRQCDTPPPSVANLVCSGSPLLYEECEGDQCAIDGEYSENSIAGAWSEWGEWSTCSEKCGTGIRRRKRTCLEGHIPSPVIAWGTHCRGQYDQLEVCNNKYCTLNGGWSGWRAWGPCSQTCGAGKRSRTRSCTRPVPSGNGTDCAGLKIEVGSCHLTPCKVYNHRISIFNGESFLQYNFSRKRSTFFHFYIRFMPLSPHGTLVRRGTAQNPRVRLSLHKWHVCLDASGSSKSCAIPRMCSPSSLEPALWHTILITVTKDAATLRLNDAEMPIRNSFPCDPELTNDVMDIYLGERLHGEVQELILNFIPLSMNIERSLRTSQSDFIPSSVSNMAYEEANIEEGYLGIQNAQYLRLPCFRAQDEWQLELTIKSKREDGIILFLFNLKTGSWFYMTLQTMRMKIKYAHDDFKSEAVGSIEYLPNQWLDITIAKKKEANTIEVTINAGERLHVFTIEDQNRLISNKFLRSCQNLKNDLMTRHFFRKIECTSYLNNNTGQKQNEICTDDFFIGGIPADIQKNISEDLTSFSGVIASLRVNDDLLDLRDYTIERDNEGLVQLSSRTASISGIYHETAWGESNKLNLTCLYARNVRSPITAASWLILDTVLKTNRNIRSVDDGRVLRLTITPENNPIGFYTCRARGIKRTKNFVTYGIIGKIHYKIIWPDTLTIIAFCTTLSLVIFTLSWLLIEGYHDIRDGYGFYRDAHLSPEEEAEVVCKFIDQKTHLIGSESAVNLEKAKARRRGRRLASQASFGAQEPEGMLKIEKREPESLGESTFNEPEELPALPEGRSLGIEPTHEVYRCDPTYVSSPKHGSNITSYGSKLSSSSVDNSAKYLCSRLLMTKCKSVSQENLMKKKITIFNPKNKSELLTIKSSTLVNKSPVQKVLQKFQELKSDDS